MTAEAGDETSAAYYLEALAAVAGEQDNPQRAVRLLAAARSQLEASGRAGCTPTCHAPRTTMPSWPRCAPHGDAAYRRPGPGPDRLERLVRQYPLE